MPDEFRDRHRRGERSCRLHYQPRGCPHRIIIDDPHNTRQAESDLERQAAIHWFDRTIGTRGVSRGVKLVVIMQRLHERDLSGHILERADADAWTHLCLPMRYEAGRQHPTGIGWTDPRHEGGALLWPAYLLRERKLAPRTVKLHVCAIRFFFVKTLKRRYLLGDTPYPNGYFANGPRLENICFVNPDYGFETARPSI